MAISANLTPRLEIKQSQSLLMTPQLRQAINLLQMTNLELNQMVEEELQTNPLLEREDDRIADSDAKEQTIDDYEDPNPSPLDSFEEDADYDNRFDDYGSDAANYDTSWETSLKNKKNNADDDFNYFEKKVSSEKSLYAFLSEQISLKFTSPKDRFIALVLTESLDEAGYFRGIIPEISKKIKVAEEKIKSVLTDLKGFEPSGVFAENLSECLAIQLKDRSRYDPMIAKLLENLDLLAARNFKELKKICEVGDEDLADMIAEIKSLNPKPTADYDKDLTGYIIPDVFVKTNKHGDFRVELNSASLPRVLINQQYASSISVDKETKRYLKEQLRHANFLVKALHQRATTILRVSEEIIKRQMEFFQKGIDFLKPMLLKDVAENLEIHESTVSRVTNGKYMLTPNGTFELKYFFSQAAGSYSGDENTSTTSIKHKIKKLIEEEKPDNILSDDKLVEEMAKLGIKIARRTIAKYRESLNIPTSADRKRTKR